MIRARLLCAATLVAVVTLTFIATSATAEERTTAGSAQAATSTRKHPNDGMNYRERMAVNYMKQRLRGTYPAKQYSLKVTPTLVQYPGNKQRPITGNRPVEVDVRLKMKKGTGGALTRLRHNMSAASKSRYFVDVRKGALPAVLEQQSMTTGARLRRKLPVGEKVHDVLHSQGVRSGAITGVLGAALSEISLPAALAAVSYGAVEMYKGVNRRTAARGSAVDKTATWARQSMANGVTPSAAEAFSTYKQYLQERKPGTHPGPFDGFLDRLATQGL
jgi:hypothetical protein